MTHPRNRYDRIRQGTLRKRCVKNRIHYDPFSCRYHYANSKLRHTNRDMSIEQLHDWAFLTGDFQEEDFYYLSNKKSTGKKQEKQKANQYFRRCVPENIRGCKYKKYFRVRHY